MNTAKCDRAILRYGGRFEGLFRSLMLGTILTGILATKASAVIYTWVGGGANNNWTTIANWSSASFPVGGNTNPDVTILLNSNASAYTSSKNGTQAFSLNKLDFEQGTGSAQVTLTVAANASTLNFVTNSGTAPSIVQNSSGGFLINGSGVAGVGGIKTDTDLTLTGTGSGLVNIGTIVSGVGRIVVDGSTRFALSGSNIYTGGTVLNSGTLQLGTGSATVLGTGTFTLNGGKVSSVTTGAKIVTVAVEVGSGATATFGDTANTGNLTFNGTTTTDANATITSESKVSFGGSFIAGNNLTLKPGGSAASITLVSLDASNGVTMDLQLGAASLLVSGALTDASSALLNFNLTGGAMGQIYTLMTFGSTTLTYADLNLLSSDLALDTSFGTNGWLINGTSIQVQTIPEPSAIWLLLIGLVGFAFYRGIRSQARTA